jgi:uncharacterized membrane protein SirB2
MFPTALRPLFEWCDATWISTAIRDSTWMFAVVEILHLLGLTVLVGSLVVLHLRLLELGMRRQTVAQLAGELSPWIRGGLSFMVGTGILLFFPEAMKCYASPPFAIKMMLLPIAIIFHLAVMRGARRATDAARLPAWSKPAAWCSLALWFGVGIAGRAIGFQ